jgi:hypothetical protein
MEAVLVVRRRPWRALRWPAVAVVLAASVLSYLALPDGRTSTTVDWIFGAAAKLHITVKTVDTHIARVRVKYANVGRAARTKSELVTRALDDGVITLAELNQASL